MTGRRTKPREPAARQRQAAPSGTRTCDAHSLERRYRELPADRRPLPASQELVHLLHLIALRMYVVPLFVVLVASNAGTRC
jgi:hypothetical protein